MSRLSTRIASALGLVALTSLAVACGAANQGAVTIAPEPATLTVESTDAQRIERYDRDGDGTTDTTTTWTYAENEVVRKGIDTDNDGRDDRIDHLTYDASGLCIRKATDRDADGTIDAVTRFEYDAAGRLARRTFDADNDGSPDRSRAFSYDRFGKKAFEVVDQGADGSFELVKEWRRDTEGSLTERVVLRRDRDSSEWVRALYGADGKMIARDLVANVALPDLGATSTARAGDDRPAITGMRALVATP